MSNISQEQENYVRMSLLLSEISPRAVRVLFDSEFNPNSLYASIKKAVKKLKKLKDKRIINQLQWTLLFPYDGDADSCNFDVTLMIALLTNLTKLKNYDTLPLKTDTSSSADLARIKYYRNKIFHNKDGNIDNTLFNSAWDDIIEAIGRLAGKKMLDEGKDLRTKILDQSTVPWNIRVQISQDLEAWKINNSNFVETRAAKHVLECVREKNCVTITASGGVGKTATLHYVALKMIDEGYDVLPVTNTHDIVKFYNPNQKTLFVIDDFCGIYSINQFDLNSLESVMERIKVLIRNKLTKIIVACRLQVYQDEKFESLSIFRTCVCNLLSEDLCLSQTEKQSIAESYLETKAEEIIQYCNLHDFFPLLCQLYNDNTEFNIIDFFKNPYSVYEAEIDTLHKKGFYTKYCALALCVMFDNELKEEWLTDEINIVTGTIMESTFEACRLDKGTSRLVLLDELKSLQHTFIKKEQGVYKTIHDKLFDFLSFYFGKKMIKSLIENADSLFIMRRCLLEKNDDIDEFITVVPPKYHDLYIQRIMNDWDKGRTQCVFYNINMKVPEFRKRFLFHLNTLDISRQRQLAHTCDEVRKDTVLMHCCRYDDIPLIEWCFYHGVDVFQCNRNGVSPLYVSAHEGHTAVLKLLLDNKADINKCTNHGQSPLFIACQKNLIEVVKVLLDNKADIYKCMDDGASPLLIACQENHIEIVKILLDKKADICKCANNGECPLFIACQNNHLEMVKILLDNKADINKCTNDGASPLFIACQLNHLELVNLLLDNKADIDRCMDGGVSPLHIACHENHIETVKVLLANKADIDKCTNNGVSALLMACQKNDLEIVKLLIENKVDINKCDANGVSPLFIACQHAHIQLVKLLLDNKADINKCTNDGISPLYCACLRKHIEIVKVLLDDKADIHICKAVPMFQNILKDK